MTLCVVWGGWFEVHKVEGAVGIVGVEGLGEVRRDGT